MQTMQETFLRDICERPADDTPRLIYADWLEDNGEAERAELIRCQCELPSLKCDWLGVPGGPCEVYNQSRGEYRVIMWCKSCRRRNALRERERELFTSTWKGNPPYACANCYAWGKDVIDLVSPHEALMSKHGHCSVGNDVETQLVLFTRGFPSHITLTEADFLLHCEAIFKAAPIEGVTLTGKEPQDYHNNGQSHLHGWHNGPLVAEHRQKWCLDPALWQAAKEHGGEVHGPWLDFNTAAEAKRALSLVAVSLARLRSGLPALE